MGTIFFVTINIVVITVLKLAKPEYRFFTDIRVYSICFTTVNFGIVTFCLLQITGVIKNDSLYNAVADFDNPAGVASLLCCTIPFALTISYKKICTILLIYEKDWSFVRACSVLGSGYCQGRQ